MAIIFLASSYYGLTQQAIGIIAHAIEISGKNLLIISFFIGFLSTTKAISRSILNLRHLLFAATL